MAGEGPRVEVARGWHGKRAEASPSCGIKHVHHSAVLCNSLSTLRLYIISAGVKTPGGAWSVGLVTGSEALSTDNSCSTVVSSLPLTLSLTQRPHTSVPPGTPGRHFGLRLPVCRVLNTVGEVEMNGKGCPGKKNCYCFLHPRSRLKQQVRSGVILTCTICIW